MIIGVLSSSFSEQQISTILLPTILLLPGLVLSPPTTLITKEASYSWQDCAATLAKPHNTTTRKRTGVALDDDGIPVVHEGSLLPSR